MTPPDTLPRLERRSACRCDKRPLSANDADRYAGEVSLIRGSRQIGRDPLDALVQSTCCWPYCDNRETDRVDLPLCSAHVAITIKRLNEPLLVPVAPREEPVPRPGYVYFIRFRDRIKIGHSIDVRTRLGAIPVDQVLAVMPGTRLDERRCHAAFADLRVQGEWFRAEPRLLEFISLLEDDSVWTSSSSQRAG